MNSNPHAPSRSFAGWLSFLVVFWLVCGPYRAGLGAPVAADAAARAAANWLSLSPEPMARRAGSPARRARAFSSASGEILFYAVDLAPAGYVVLAADDQLEPIVAFSHEDRFEGVTGNPLFDLLRRDMGERRSRVAKAAASGGPPSDIAAGSKWRKLLGLVPGSALVPQSSPPAAEPAVDDPRVDPLLQSRWNQNTIWAGESSVAVYNYYTPPYGAGNPNNFDSGCTATAWAQIMFFHQWPAAGVGTRSFPITVSGRAWRRALMGGDGNGGPYDWSGMVAIPGSAITTAQRQAIGALLADAGVANGMDYEQYYSAADLESSSVKGVFQYASGVQSWYPISHADLIRALGTNLDAGLPVWMAIENDDYSSDGHAVVVDGYGYNAGTLYHHLNMGWGGADDAWYNLPNIDTATPDPTYSFNMVDDCIYNIDPATKGEIVTGRVTGTDGFPVAGIPVAACAGALQYGATSNARGIYAIKGLPSSTRLSVTCGSVVSSSPASATVATGDSADGKPVGGRTGIDFQVVTLPPDMTAVAMRTGSAPGVPGARFLAFGFPSIANGGHVAFQATISPAPSTGNSGIWADSGTNQCVLVVLTGSAAPGVAGGVFTALGDPVYNNRDQVAFVGNLKTGRGGVARANSTGIWSNSSGTLALAALSGSQAAGCGTGVVFTSFQQLVLPDQGGVVFLATLGNGTPAAGVSARNNLGIWAGDGTGGLRLIARTGTPQSDSDDGVKVTSLTLFGDAGVTKVRPRGFNGSGSFVYNAGYSNGAEGICEASYEQAPQGIAGASPIAGVQCPLLGNPTGAPGEAGPQIPGARFVSFGYSSLNDAGHTAFLATISGTGIKASNRTGIWTGSGTSGWTLVARTGVAIPGIARGEFTALSSPVNNNSDQVAFLGTLNAAAPGLVKAGAPGVWLWSAASGSLAAVAGVGEPAPDCQGALFAAFMQLALPGQGGVVLLAALSGPGVSAADNEGVWAVDPAGALHLAVRKGADLLGGLNPITTLSALTSSPVTMPQPGGFNSPGDLVYRATFKDGTQGIFTAAFPGGN